MSTENMVQYSVRDGIFVRSPRTQSRVEAGFYDVIDTSRYGHGLQPKSIVSDDLIDLPGTPADAIFSDIERFMQIGPALRDLGLTHKRGYLMYGPGGTGKTSIGLMLGRKFIASMDGVVMFAPDTESLYHGVSIMRDLEPGRPSMYLIEEADRIVDNTHCLSILDGGLSIQGAVFVAMTNYKGALPPRITNRPGRFAMTVLIDSPPLPVQVEYLTRLAHRRPDLMNGCNTPRSIVDGLAGISMTMDHLREAFVSHVLMGQSVEEIRERFAEMAASKEKAEVDDDDSYGVASDGWEPSGD